MRVEKNGTPITCLADWQRLAHPKSASHWIEGRSAYELARAWCGTQGPAVPEQVHSLFESSPATRGLAIERAIPEHRIPFDTHGGEPRNADLAFTGIANGSRVAVTVEAKADEPFGATVAETMAAALERAVQNPASRGVRRVEDLARAILSSQRKGQCAVGELRYQLLTATAGTLAYAISEQAAVAVLMVHEFVTNKTQAHLHDRNADDFAAFLDRLGSSEDVHARLGILLGPFSAPGKPLFERTPALYVGKIVTNCRVGGV